MHDHMLFDTRCNWKTSRMRCATPGELAVFVWWSISIRIRDRVRRINSRHHPFVRAGLGVLGQMLFDVREISMWCIHTSLMCCGTSTRKYTVVCTAFMLTYHGAPHSYHTTIALCLTSGPNWNMYKAIPFPSFHSTGLEPASRPRLSE